MGKDFENSRLERQSDYGKRKRKMLDKARVLFCKKGYNGARMKDLAESFGCKPANIYNYFESKEELLFEVLREEMEQILLPLIPLEQDKLDEPLRALSFFIKHHAKITLGYRRAAKMLFDTELGHLSPSRRKVIIDMRRQYDRILCRIIAKGIEQGLFRTSNVKLAAYSIASMVARSRVWYSVRGELSLDEVGDFLFEMAAGGLNCEAAAGAPGGQIA